MRAVMVSLLSPVGGTRTTMGTWSSHVLVFFFQLAHVCMLWYQAQQYLSTISMRIHCVTHVALLWLCRAVIVDTARIFQDEIDSWRVKWRFFSALTPLLPDGESVVRAGRYASKNTGILSSLHGLRMCRPCIIKL